METQSAITIGGFALIILGLAQFIQSLVEKFFKRQDATYTLLEQERMENLRLKARIVELELWQVKARQYIMLQKINQSKDKK